MSAEKLPVNQQLELFTELGNAAINGINYLPYNVVPLRKELILRDPVEQGWEFREVPDIPA